MATARGSKPGSRPPSSRDQASLDTASGTVLSQDPAGGTTVNENSTVNLVVSSGAAVIPDPVLVYTGFEDTVVDGNPIRRWFFDVTNKYEFPIEFFEWKLPPILAKDEPLSETLYGVHGVLGVAILALAVLHASAAMMHWLVRRDGVMHRMTFG